mmetsp:Transcript_55417/g.88390  ORF Transcript_55417/g.88390 Transcript_55417/m.88390 type:complete len:200 (+) Transcript_55417:49-648(+)|eukprot:CAMPEP_0197021188 /NCGR_PEP_ID=MMETSP1384-20130603/2088_1 /TAXON_ID=29189 /ORGANISM="Ammonia sp." /LENGTH=199 /DNA_ID=CAMNT_0042448959 /DNA_START=30 /DNA_END=629 /DNA_ORIENTATION=-
MSVQNAAAQLLQIEKQQNEIEAQIKVFQAALAKLQGDDWQSHFTKQLTAIKGQVADMEQTLLARQKENKRLKQERDVAQKEVDDLTEKLRESQASHAPSKPLCGGLMNKEIDDNIKSIAAKMKEQVIKKATADKEKCAFDEFTPIEAKSQVVAGVNWYLKIRTAKNAFIHIKVWAKLDKSHELTAIQYNKAESDPLTPF